MGSCRRRAACWCSGPAFAEKRVALVLGNSAYQNVAPLANPVNDSAKIAATLKDAGFDVVDSRRDLPAAETRRALRDFADRARDADIAVVYYAGHGIEVDGANYLIPVDARLERDTDIYDEGLSLDRILIAIEPAKKLRLVILDACRDNPFSRTMKRTVASRAIGQGLAKVEPTSPNVLIAYSAKAGSTAADGDGKNSPFTAALSHHLDEARARRAPGVRLRPRRGAQDHRQQAGAVCVWFARRRRRAAGAGRRRPRRPRLPRPPSARRPKPAAITNWRCRSATRARSTPSSRNIPTVSTPALPSFSSTRSRPRRPASPRPRRRGWPNRSGRGSPPRAPRSRSRQRPKPMPKPPSRRASRPKRPSRWRRTRPLRRTEACRRRSRGTKRLPLRRRLLRLTGHLTELARTAAATRELLVVVGGDGTLNEVVNGIAALGRMGALAGCPPAPDRTWEDARDPERLRQAVRVALEGRRGAIDLGRVRFRGGERWFANVGSTGMSGAVARRANGMTKAFGGRATFYYALTREFVAWRNTEVTVT